MRVLITGGAGFIGSHLAQRLVGDGHEVVVLDNFSSGHRENLAGLDLAVVEGDIRDRDDLLRAMNGAQWVLHHAAMVSVPDSMSDPERSYAINQQGTAKVLDCARSVGVERVVFASSSAVYGDVREVPTPESAPTKPLSPYGSHKLAGERLCHEASQGGGPDCVAFRYFNVFGARQRADSDYSAVVPIFRERCRRGELPVIYGDGAQIRDFVFVGDVVEANIRALQRNAPWGGEIVNVGSGLPTSVADLAATIMALEGCAGSPMYRAARAGDIRDSVADVSKIEEELSWRPSTSLVVGLRTLG